LRSGLILAGHGSHISPETAGLVWRIVDQLRSLGAADEITAAFWKEQPAFHDVLRTIDADQITVVPLFTTRGFFTQAVIPAEMGLSGPLTLRGGQTILYTRTLSETPYLAAVVKRRITAILAEQQIDPGRCGVVLIGHSTRRNAESRLATEAQAAQIRSLGLVAEVTAVYLDDEPPIRAMYERTTSPTLIAVPFFLAAGSHVTMDVPDEIGLPRGVASGSINGRQVWYTGPVGSEADLVQAVWALTDESGTKRSQAESSTAWSGFPTVGQTDLFEAVQGAGILVFGDLTLTPEQVRVTGIPSPDARAVGTDAGPTPDVLRTAARMGGNTFRPLASQQGLHLPWTLDYTGAALLHAIVETIYPGAVADWALHRQAERYRSTLMQTIERQVGQFRQLAALPETRIQALVSDVCGDCIRHPAWHDGSSTPIPCFEPCNLWLSAALRGQANDA
jgi:sirohydrochlorin cobaltochelatase